MTRSKGGFSLVELMMVVAVMMTLAAIAIPMAAKASSKAKATEAYVNQDALSDALGVYINENGLGAGATATWVPADPWSASTDGRKLRAWPTTNPGAFQRIGFRPDGQVRCGYWLSITAISTPLQLVCDVDGDGTYMFFFQDWDTKGTQQRESWTCRQANNQNIVFYYDKSDGYANLGYYTHGSKTPMPCY